MFRQPAALQAKSDCTASFRPTSKNGPVRLQTAKPRCGKLDYFALGTHEFKGGYALYRTGEYVLQGFKTSYTQIYPSSAYTPKTDAKACDTIIAQNAAVWPTSSGCQGDYGYFIVTDGVDTTGKSAEATMPSMVRMPGL